MAEVTITTYAVIIDHVESETPLLSREALAPSWEDEARKRLPEIGTKTAESDE